MLTCASTALRRPQRILWGRPICATEPDVEQNGYVERDQIFVSYSHRDKRWLDELVITLKPLTRKRKIQVWDDTKIGVGAKWRAEIARALRRAKVAVLLVSRYFLYSDFIADEELPHLLNAAKKEGLIIVWVAVGFSSYEDTEIAEYQAVNDPSHPLNSLSESEVDFELVKIAREIDSIFDIGDYLESVDSADAPVPADIRPVTEGGEESSDGARERIREALTDGKWAWRTVGALAAKAGMTEEQTLSIVRRDSDIVLGRGKSGKQIARLKSRVP